MQIRLRFAGLVVAAAMVSGCNTVAGVGQDLQAAGGVISETSDDVREFLITPKEPAKTASTGKYPANR